MDIKRKPSQSPTLNLAPFLQRLGLFAQRLGLAPLTGLGEQRLKQPLARALNPNLCPHLLSPSWQQDLKALLNLLPLLGLKGCPIKRPL